MVDTLNYESVVNSIENPAFIADGHLNIVATNVNEDKTSNYYSLLSSLKNEHENSASTFQTSYNGVELEVSRLKLSGNNTLFIFKHIADKQIDNLKSRLFDYLKIVHEYAWETDPYLNFTFLSEKTKSILGFDSDEISGLSIKDIIPKKDWLALFNAIKKHVSEGEVFSGIIHQVVHKDGQQLWVSTNGIPLFDDNNTFLGIRGVSLDVTDERNAVNSLEKSNKNYELLFEQTPSGVFHYNYDLKIRDCNQAFSDILKTSKENLIGMDMRSLIDKRVLPAIVQGIEGSKGVYKGPYLTTHSGIQIYINLVCVPLLNENNVIGGIGLVKDITESYEFDFRLKRQLAFENLALEISNLFINISETEYNNLLNTAVSKISHFLNLDASKLFLLGDKKKVFYAPIIWSSNNDFDIERHKVFEIAKFSQIIDKLKTGELLKFERKKRKTNALNWDLNKQSEICYLLPLILNNELLGFWELSYSTPRISEDAQDFIILKQLAYTFSSVIARNINTQQLIQKEKRFESLVQNLSDLITILNTSGSITYNTSSFYRVTGYEIEIIGKNIGHLIHPKDLKHVLRSFFFVRDNPRSEITIELRLKKADGSYGYFESFISNLLHIPSVNGIVINSRDITDRKHAEREIFEKQSLISAVSRTIPGFIVVYDLSDRKIIYKNRENYIIDLLFDKNHRNSASLKGKGTDLEDFRNVLNSKTEVIKSIYRFRTLSLDGSYSWFTCSISKFTKDKEGQSSQILILINDNTEKRQSEIAQDVLFNISENARSAESNEELYKMLFDQLNRLVPLENYYLAISHDNGQTVEFPYQHGSDGSFFNKRVKGGKLTDYVIKSGEPLIADYNKLMQFEKQGRFTVKGTIPLSVIASPLRIKGNTTGAIIVYSYNNKVTYTQQHLNALNFICDEIALSLERKRFTESIEEEKLIANAIINNLPGIYFLTDYDGKIIRWNKNLELTTGLKANEVKSANIFDLFEKSSREQIKNKIVGVSANKYVEIETKLSLESNKSIPVILTCVNVIIKNNSFISGIGIDISEKTKAEEQIQQSLKEKQILLSEVHHRVKNNLAIITGLLNLQQHSHLDNVTRNVLKDSETRIRSMAIIHEKLYQSEIFSTVEIKGYIDDLAGYIEHVFETNTEISVAVNCDNFYMPLDQAIPFGLIINELFTNSYKHAFKNRESGKITVHLNIDESKIIHFQFSDNGIGFQLKHNHKSKSLGFQLIDGLTKQLDGICSFKSGSGTIFELTFKINEKDINRRR